MKFIDLFAGLGGFHVALEELGHECVFACEIVEELRDLYQKNFGILPAKDIKKLDLKNDIPSHDILCAGFPCQPFSKAGRQNGLSDSRGGFLENEIAQILKIHKPKYFILENVPNIKKHDNNKTWKLIKKILGRDYEIDEAILSPHNFGIPQIRNRIYIVGARKGLKKFKFPEIQNNENLTIKSILSKNPKEATRLNNNQIRCLEIWQKIISKIPKEEKLMSPIWSMEFGATYDFENKAPYAQSCNQLYKKRGKKGILIKSKNKEEQLLELPRYARTKQDEFPNWKKIFIRKNREFYKKHKNIFDPYLKEIRNFPHSWQKLEWNCGNEKKDIFKYLLQFRPSGIRVKRINYAPTLVLSSSQIPIIGWELRYLTVKETAKLQSLEKLKFFKNKEYSPYKALGNAVNSTVVKEIAKKLLSQESKKNIITNSKKDIKLLVK